MYAKVGKFRPGDIIKHINNDSSKFKIIRIKYRKDTDHLYKLLRIDNNLYKHVHSDKVISIDKSFKLNLKSILKKL